MNIVAHLMVAVGGRAESIRRGEYVGVSGLARCYGSDVDKFRKVCQVAWCYEEQAGNSASLLVTGRKMAT